jgi:hypothetical protein
LVNCIIRCRFYTKISNIMHVKRMHIWGFSLFFSFFFLFCRGNNWVKAIEACTLVNCMTRKVLTWPPQSILYIFIKLEVEQADKRVKVGKTKIQDLFSSYHTLIFWSLPSTPKYTHCPSLIFFHLHKSTVLIAWILVNIYFT